MDGAMANRVDGHHVPPAFAFGHRMMPFDAVAQRAAAKPARRAFAHFAAQVVPIHLPLVLAFMLMFMPLGAPVIFMSMCIS